MYTHNTGAPERTPQAADADETSLLDLILVLAENLRLLVFGPVLAGLLALGITYAIAPTYTSRVVMLPPQQPQSAASVALQSLGSLAGLAGGAAGIKSPADQYVALMQTATVENRLIDRFNLLVVYEKAYKADARKELERNTRITIGKKDGLITVEVDDTSPQRAADIANAYVEEIRKLASSLAISEAQGRRLFFEKQLTRTKEDLAAAQKALQSAGVNEGTIRAEPRAAVEAYARIQAEVTASEVRLQTMRGFLAETAPEFQRMQGELIALRKQLARREALNAASIQSDYVDRFREFKYHETLFELLSRQYEIARIDESREGAVIQVVDAAFAAERKSKPRRAIATGITSFGTLILLLGLVFLREALRSASRVEPTAGKLTTLRVLTLRALGRSLAR
jgi:capsule polysaccharide export protein KpsE/RkpR